MGLYETLAQGQCPNKCGELTKFEKPIAILYTVPVELLEVLYEGYDTPEDIFGYLLAHCDKCGFNLTTPPKADAFDHLDNITVLGLEPPQLFSRNYTRERTDGF